MATNFKQNLEGKSGDWRCIVIQEPWNNRVKIYLFQVANGRTMQSSIKDGKMELREIKEGQDPEDKPLLQVSREVWQALSDTLREVIPNIEKNEVDAELKATKYHLEDMRKLIFKSK